MWQDLAFRAGRTYPLCVGSYNLSSAATCRYRYHV
jgi:hypothetical protein